MQVRRIGKTEVLMWTCLSYKVNEDNSRFTGIRQRGKFEKFKPTNGERESVTTDTMATENIIITDLQNFA